MSVGVTRFGVTIKVGMDGIRLVWLHGLGRCDGGLVGVAIVGVGVKPAVNVLMVTAFSFIW